MLPSFPDSWRALEAERDKAYFQQLEQYVTAERQAGEVYPPAGQEFAALEATPLPEVKVFILGQDPYHGPNQGHGLAFSVLPGVRKPPSLVNIFRELREDIGCPEPADGYLMPWAEQGVLLLNAVLTVRCGEANSHKGKGWEKFTDAVIRTVNAQEERVVFVLWGGYAGKKAALIDEERHTILRSVHPSPLSAYNGFYGSKPFSQANEILRASGRPEIDWRLPAA